MDAADLRQSVVPALDAGRARQGAGQPDERAADRAEAIVEATRNYDNPDVIAKVSRKLGPAMVGINVESIPVPHRLAERGW